MLLAPCQTVFIRENRERVRLIRLSVNVAHAAKEFCVLSQPESNAIFFFFSGIFRLSLRHVQPMTRGQ